MNGINKVVFLGVSAIMLAITIFVVLFSIDTSRKSINEFSITIEKMFGKAGEPKFTKYSGQYVDGKTVRSIMEEFGGEYFIKIKTKKNPVSFVVAHQPINYTIMVERNGTNDFLSYVDSSSLCYVNENALFMSKVIRDSSNSVLGVSFTEKGSGAITKIIKDTYLNGNSTGTVPEAKQKYTQLLQSSTNALNTSTIINNTANVRTKIEQLKDAAAESDAKLFMNTNTTVDNSAYEQKKNERDTAKQNAENAWNALIQLCQSTTGREVFGHNTITFNSIFDLDDSANLQFWISLYNEGR